MICKRNAKDIQLFKLNIYGALIGIASCYIMWTTVKLVFMLTYLIRHFGAMNDMSNNILYLAIFTTLIRMLIIYAFQYLVWNILLNIHAKNMKRYFEQNRWENEYYYEC